MGKWFPLVYDALILPLEKTKFKRIRTQLIAKVEGEVLEIGSGTGVNFPIYKNAHQVVAIEPNPEMTKHAAQNIKKSKVPIRSITARAEQLPFEDNTFDTVVATLVFCTIPNPIKALQEIERVCKPGATIQFFEHVKMKQPFLAKLQEVCTPFWKKVCDGCHLNRDTLELVNQSNLNIKQVDSFYKGLLLTITCTKE
ncbi:class I SAM-dependent methyltransferase [Salinibacillus xinjiangensis]|uniref:Methyltransferase domain-containing protein n=1 Tax=Salinibacillus xinjiangensis TaxID=1229268 RepID=A0A6G1X673_9BACI|nr:class I SAM-dependent methyltransferase [Salinibacillus xinjiangensis]MRG86501.1 methyltransferase domain-containing protein [Salinibacillus xinjiangensis]